MSLPQAVVLDLDGTLIDSAPEIGAALNRLLARHGRRPVSGDQVRMMVGDGALSLLGAAFAATGAPLSPEAERAVLEEYLDDLAAEPARRESIYPGVEATLRLLRGRGMRIGICTNKAERVTELVLEQLGLASLIDAFAGGDTLPWRKPDGRHPAHVAELLGVPPAQAAMVGDGLNDVKAARGAGMPVVAVSYGYPRMPVADLGADLVIDGFADLPAALEALPRRG
ncbi:HAD-IA family hydrolase [Arenibaculum pallidiluteum]|uniref:HAD-IA family hydrolase n=1 Tax=Arenibaculum pallidiluteum TaxID=2812559 RepID=UPI001A95CE30|nr:HAD-IA family hydrolase [Arenibaculum pallidiluteum]